MPRRRIEKSRHNSLSSIPLRYDKVIPLLLLPEESRKALPYFIETCFYEFKERHLLGWLTYYQIRQVDYSPVGVSVRLVRFNGLVGGFNSSLGFAKCLMVSKEKLIKQQERESGAFEGKKYRCN